MVNSNKHFLLVLNHNAESCAELIEKAKRQIQGLQYHLSILYVVPQVNALYKEPGVWNYVYDQYQNAQIRLLEAAEELGVGSRDCYLKIGSPHHIAKEYVNALDVDVVIKDPTFAQRLMRAIARFFARHSAVGRHMDAFNIKHKHIFL